MSTPLRCLVNGRVSDKLPVTDRGLAYGDGVFETIGIRGGLITLWHEHYQRLASSCSRLGFDAPDQTVLERDINKVIQQPEAVCKIIVTRGDGGRGYLAPAPAAGRRVVMSFPWPEHPAAWSRTGVRLRVCRQRLAIQPELAGLKHLNRLEQVMARSEWRNRRIADGLMLDRRDHLIEGTATNLFVLLNKTLVTPRLDQCGVNGVMRQWIIDHFQVVERRLKISDLSVVDALFVCNSVVGVWPVRAIDGIGRFQVAPVRHALNRLPWSTT